MGEKSVRTTKFITIFRNNIRNYSMFLILALIMLIFAPMVSWRNFSARNITNIFFQYSYVLILAVGMVQCIIILGIDLSVGSVCAFAGAITAMIYNTGVGMPITVISGLLIGLGVGAFQGLWIAYARIPAFIVTLAGMMLFRGLTYFVTHINPISLNDDGYSYLATGTVDEVLKLAPIVDNGNLRLYPASLVVGGLLVLLFIVAELLTRRRKIANDFEVSSTPIFIGKLAIISALVLSIAERFASYRGLPIVALVVGVTVFVFHFILNNTVLGRYIYAVGGNSRSAKLSGINSEFITFIVFCFMGMMTGLAAVVSTGYMNSALPQAGQNFEMDAIAACYIGGVSAAGGIGTVVGVIVGGLVMSAINNGMSLMNLGQEYQYVVKGAVVLLAVYYDVYTRHKAGLG